MKRREFLKLSLGAAAVASVSPSGACANAAEGNPDRLPEDRRAGDRAAAGACWRSASPPGRSAIKWIEFTSGPPLLEAMSIGSIDLGSVGDTPPIFAQAANANVLYVAGSRITNGQGILVPANSPSSTIADLKGKRVGFTKGSSAHNVVIADAGKGRADLRGHHAGLSDAARCGPGLRQWQHRCLGGLGSVFRDRREASRTARILVNAA